MEDWAELLKPVRDGKLYRMPIAETQVIVNGRLAAPPRGPHDR